MKYRHKQPGFTLTELLISLVLGAFVVSAVLSVFLGGLTTFRTTDSLSRMQESARFVLERMRFDLRQAGYFGCRSTLRQEQPRSEGALGFGLIRNTLNPPPAAGGDPLLGTEFDFGVPLVGYDGTGDGTGASWTSADSTIPIPSGTSILINPRDDSDILILVRADGAGLRVDAHPGGTPPGSANVQVASDNGLEQGDIIFITDCLSAGIFEISGANPDTSGTLAHNTGNSVVPDKPGNYTKSLGRTFVGAEVFRMQRAAYYVANSPITGRPALFRNGEEIAENVEQMQVLYGVDTTFDARINDYMTATELAGEATVSVDNVLSVRIDLLFSSGEEDNLADQPVQITFNDGGIFTATDRRLYRAFSATIGIRNRLP